MHHVNQCVFELFYEMEVETRRHLTAHKAVNADCIIIEVAKCRQVLENWHALTLVDRPSLIVNELNTFKTKYVNLRLHYFALSLIKTYSRVSHWEDELKEIISINITI